jgi:flagellar export protein FliJ
MSERSKKFTFRLATVLKVSRIREDQEKARLAASQRAAADAERAEAERQSAYEARPTAVAGPVDEFEQAKAVIDLRARALREAAEARVEAEAQLSAARDSWLSAARRVKTLEELEDRHYAAHATVAARAAQRALDDLARARKRQHES